MMHKNEVTLKDSPLPVLVMPSSAKEAVIARSKKRLDLTFIVGFAATFSPVSLPLLDTLGVPAATPISLVFTAVLFSLFAGLGFWCVTDTKQKGLEEALDWNNQTDALIQKARGVLGELPENEAMRIQEILQPLFQERIRLQEARSEASERLERWHKLESSGGISKPVPEGIALLADHDAIAADRLSECESGINKVLADTERSLLAIGAGSVAARLHEALLEPAPPTLAMLNARDAIEATDPIRAIAAAQEEIEREIPSE